MPTFGYWGLILAHPGDTAPTLGMPANASSRRFFNPQVLETTTVFSGDIGPLTLGPSTLQNPRTIEDRRHGYDYGICR
ncbi:hypothetical protein [Mycobacterium lepromatosis]|uniref:hypothetical protein n=1 Tax=Mycobacterium lepromatosis TaxID=480418 RepID=UPI0005F87176|nr:hypothetical protein [Mycobacterium lepromatosis]